MSAWVIALLVIILIPVLAGVWGISRYNRLIALRTGANTSWSQVDVELQRRHDLIPNLVATVKAYAGHERNTLEEVVALRNQAAAMSGGQPGQLSPQRAQVEDQLTQAVHNFLVTVESYPDLKANGNFQALQAQLVETEDRISAGRRYYNACVANYNIAREQFPTSIIAGMFAAKFPPATGFEVANIEVRQSQTVDFGPGFETGPTITQQQAQAAGNAQIPAPTYQQAYPNNPMAAPGQLQAAQPAPMPQQQYQIPTQIEQQPRFEQPGGPTPQPEQTMYGTPPQA